MGSCFRLAAAVRVCNVERQVLTKPDVESWRRGGQVSDCLQRERTRTSPQATFAVAISAPESGRSNAANFGRVA
jgi:hypothetical protein